MSCELNLELKDQLYASSKGETTALNHSRYQIVAHLVFPFWRACCKPGRLRREAALALLKVPPRCWRSVVDSSPELYVNRKSLSLKSRFLCVLQ